MQVNARPLQDHVPDTTGGLSALGIASMGLVFFRRWIGRRATAATA
ncbi:MAG: hypothetical protein HY299_13600 [Verrucomicrobia bacterium]|nr:hypothetical protein [Verrucomicrobiota bacterium]